MHNEHPPVRAAGPRRARHWRNALLASTMIGAVAVSSVAIHAQPLPSAPVQQTLPSLAPIVDKVMPAVVNISVTLKNDSSGIDVEPGMPFPGFPENSPFDEFLKRFFQHQRAAPGQDQGKGQERPHGPVGQRVALGSGFIVDPSGYVVTNNHVVGQADKVTVVLQDNTKHPAKIIGRDEKTDIALLKIDTGKPLPYVKFGDSNAAKVGDWVVAVGNPFGLGGSVTAGIISARGRDLHAGPFDDFLQIDAPINRGNSGGPTFNQQGEVVGINTAIYSPNGGSVGIGFAIPSNLAKNIVAQLKEHGKVTRGWLGVAIQSITPGIAKSLGLDANNPQGALVASVTPDSPAAKAGLKEGDIIADVNGQAIHTAHDLPRLVAETPVGGELDIMVRRQGKEKKLAAHVAEMPANPQMASRGPRGGEPAKPEATSALGLQLAPLTAELHKRLHVPDGVEGVVVRGIADDSPIAPTGLQPGDVIVSIDQQPAGSPEEAAKKLKEAAAKGQVLLLLNRRGNNQFVGLSIENGNGSSGDGEKKSGKPG
jgi:serine protease Do